MQCVYYITTAGIEGTTTYFMNCGHYACNESVLLREIAKQILHSEVYHCVYHVSAMLKNSTQRVYIYMISMHAPVSM